MRKMRSECAMQLFQFEILIIKRSMIAPMIILIKRVWFPIQTKSVNPEYIQDSHFFITDFS